ncbi:MAG: transposase [Candidatus Omnitrophota bacterium]
MARQARDVYDGAVFHIIQRGNNCQPLLKSTSDFLRFLGILKKYKKQYGFEIYNYCLMKNHIHMLMKIKLGETAAKLFQGIFQSFQMHHRKEYGYTGRLYQNRYISKLVERDSYMLECARYIERNPLSAKLVTSLDDYRWVSYHFYSHGKADPLITPNPLYLDLAKTRTSRKKRYLKYLLQERLYETDFEEKVKKMMLVRS